METTQLDDRRRGPTPQPWWLIVVHHPDLACVGRRLAVPTEGELALGRATPQLEARDDLRMSRVHATVRLGPSGPLLVDAASRNGTTVNGERVAERALLEDDLVGVGSVLLLARRASPELVPRAHPRIPHAGHAIAKLLEELAAVAPRPLPVWFFGETGTGKGLLAEELHLASSRAGAFVSLRCGACAELSPRALLEGDGEREGLVAKAQGGTLFVDGLEDATPALQSALVPVLDDARGVRVVASSMSAPSELLSRGVVRPDLASRFAAWTFEVPALRHRREDIAAIAAQFLAATTSLRPSLELSAALLRGAFPGNVRELVATLERASLDGRDGEIPATPRILALLSTSAAPPEPPERPVSIAIEESGAWLEPAGGERVSLLSRKTLRRLLAELVRAHREEKERSLTVAELLAAGWPDERVLPRAGASRVYVAMTSLRQLGLRELLDRTPLGYRLAPRANVRVEAS
jgi:transcriptional regulator with AAA-type ATPase domain